MSRHVAVKLGVPFLQNGGKMLNADLSLYEKEKRYFEEVFTPEMQRKIYRLIRGLLPKAMQDEIGDVHQLVFAKAWKYLADFKGDSSMYTWVYRIATNTCFDQIRKHKAEITVSINDQGGPQGQPYFEVIADERWSTDPFEQLSAVEIRMKIKSAMNLLTEKERLVFELRHWSGLRLREVGEIIGSSEETAKNYLFRATKKMRAALAEQGLYRSHRSVDNYQTSKNRPEVISKVLRKSKTVAEAAAKFGYTPDELGEECEQLDLMQELRRIQ